MKRKNDGSLSPLHIAVENRDLTGLEQLLGRKGFNTESTDGEEATPLHYAVSTGDVEIARLLLIARASIEAKDNEGDTPMTIAVKCADLAMISLLHEFQADLEAEDQFGSHPLHWAAKNGYHEVIELLIKLGSSVNSVDKQGNTPLHQAASTDSLTVASLLMSRGANPGALNNKGNTPIHESINNTDPTIMWNDFNSSKEMIEIFWAQGVRVTEEELLSSLTDFRAQDYNAEVKEEQITEFIAMLQSKNHQPIEVIDPEGNVSASGEAADAEHAGPSFTSSSSIEDHHTDPLGAAASEVEDF